MLGQDRNPFLRTIRAAYDTVAAAPDGQLPLAFQVRDEPRQLTDWHGHAVSLDTYRQLRDEIADLLGAAGLVVHARPLRAPAGDTEKVPRAYLLDRRPAAVS